MIERVINYLTNVSKNLQPEIKDVLSYFKEHTPNKSNHELLSVHSGRITVGKDPETKEYFWETDGVRKTAGVDSINRAELNRVREMIHNITVPYAEHIKKNKK